MKVVKEAVLLYKLTERSKQYDVKLNYPTQLLYITLISELINKNIDGNIGENVGEYITVNITITEFSQMAGISKSASVIAISNLEKMQLIKRLDAEVKNKFQREASRTMILKSFFLEQ